MELALYHPVHGYYSSPGEKTGKRGDYLTSPQISPLFAQCLARFIGSGSVVELGAGDGTLAAELAPQFPYIILERSPDFRRRQEARLLPLPYEGEGRGEGLPITWLDLFPEHFQGTVISNELLDALPVHRLLRDQERYVREDLTEDLGPYSTPRIGAYFHDLNLEPAGEAEVNLDALDLMTTVYTQLDKGRVLTIDYGYDAETLFVGHPQGSFMTYYRHSANDKPYENVGYKDMTSHVDFTSLIHLGESLGLRTAAFTTQADFLSDYGLGELLVQAQEHAADVSDYAALRQAGITLMDPAGMGGFRVLVQEKPGS